MMTDQDWLKCRYLKKTDRWGDLSLIHEDVILTLDEFCRTFELEPFVLCGTQGTHVNDSYHYKGLAIDFMLKTIELHELIDIVFNLLRFPFMGVGLYTDWKLFNYPKGGFHVDLRPQKTKALWLRNKDGYQALSATEFRKSLEAMNYEALRQQRLQNFETVSNAEGTKRSPTA